MSSVESHDPTIQKMLLRVICFCVLLSILAAGLWPFHAPKNDVSWLSQGNGLLIGQYGSIMSAGAFNADKSRKEAPCSLEIWLRPSLDYSGAILAYYSPESSVVVFELWQSHHNLGIQRTSLDQFRHGERNEIYVSGVLRPLKSVLITISSGPAGTAVYADGVLVKNAPSFRCSAQDLTGQLVLGDAPTSSNHWSGQLRGLAVYDHELAAGEVSEHYTRWTTNQQAELAKNEGVVALYFFDEGNGMIVHNHVESAPSLFIPKRFFVLDQQFLERPWDEFKPVWPYWKDIGVNIAGFIPLGFFFRAYFSAMGKAKKATWVTIALGFAVSLTIEVLQAFLPTRDSGMTDLITNTLGTVLGAIACVWSIRHNYFAPVGGPWALSFEKEGS